jgi:hypothetical protein
VDAGDGLQVLGGGVAASLLNKQSRIADKEWSPNLGFVGGVNNS